MKAPTQQGESPCQAGVPPSVTEGYCVAKRRGGELPEVNNRSETQVNSIRLLVTGEAASSVRSPEPRPKTPRGVCSQGCTVNGQTASLKEKENMNKAVWTY